VNSCAVDVTSDEHDNRPILFPAPVVSYTTRSQSSEEVTAMIPEEQDWEERDALVRNQEREIRRKMRLRPVQQVPVDDRGERERPGLAARLSKQAAGCVGFAVAVTGIAIRGLPRW
jgi:hypothetical protein